MCKTGHYFDGKTFLKTVLWKMSLQLKSLTEPLRSEHFRARGCWGKARVLQSFTLSPGRRGAGQGCGGEIHPLPWRRKYHLPEKSSLALCSPRLTALNYDPEGKLPTGGCSSDKIRASSVPRPWCSGPEFSCSLSHSTMGQSNGGKTRPAKRGRVKFCNITPPMVQVTRCLQGHDGLETL